MFYRLLFVVLFLLPSALVAQEQDVEDVLFTLDVLRGEIAELERQAKVSQSETEKDELLRRAAELRSERRLEFAHLTDKLLPSLTDDTKKQVAGFIREDLEAVEVRFKDAQKQVRSLRKTLENADPEQADSIEDAIDQNRRTMTDLLGVELSDIEHLEKLGVDATALKERFAKDLEKTARTVSSTLTTLLDERQQIAKRTTTTDDEKAQKNQATNRVQDRIDRAVTELRVLVELLKRTGADATTYQQLLIESTGTVTADILDADVSLGLIQKWSKQAQQWFAQNAITILFKIIWFVLIILIAKLISAVVRRLVRRWVKRSGFSLLAQQFLEGAAARVVFWIGILFGVSQLGFDVTALIAGFGVAGIVVGFALQDTLSNFASGLMILFYRPFDTGDLIRAGGVEGVVDKMTLVSTEVLTLDNQRFVIPNNKVWQNVIQNVTAETTRRVDFKFGVGYDDDLKKAEQILFDIVSAEEHVLDEPKPIVRVHELGDSSINFVVRMWVNTDDYWETYWNVTRAVKDQFDEAGVTIPYPQRDVHLHGFDKAS